MKPNDQSFMQRAISLAARGKGRVSPNPCVGCVIVKKGRVVGEGFHARYGGPHAEVVALRAAGDRARGADMYLTLEPCTHFGKTPPCAPEVIRSGVKRVFIAMKDPNPLVAGRGIAALRRAGIQVTVGLEGRWAELLNRSFITWMTKGRPHIVLKMASSLDGKIASRTGNSRWISGKQSRNLVHRLRAESDAVLVGAGTASIDNPRLTSHGAGRDPLRIVLDPRLRTKPSLHLYRDGLSRTLVVAGASVSESAARRRTRGNVSVVRIPSGKDGLNLLKLLNHLAKMNVSQLLVEGGGDTAWYFLKAGLVDEIVFFLAPVLVGGRTAPTSVGGDGFTTIGASRRLDILSTVKVGDDILVHGLVN